MLAFNEVAGTNYLFVSTRPDNPSVLDFMGPWPWYLGVELIVGLTVWAMLTWPWTRSGRARRSRNAGVTEGA
jgi:uncharacterized membrane protein YwaF